MSRVSIRSAALDDIPAILALEQSAAGASHWTVRLYKSRIQSPREETCFLVANLDEKPAGFICARTVAGEWEIENVIVGEQFRRKGVASELMQSLLAKWEERAGTALLLEVRESNVAARALYTKYGFREVGRRPQYYREPPEDAILYARHRT